MTKQDHNTLKEVATFHKDWVRVCTVLVSKRYAEDITQDMYLHLVKRKVIDKIKYKNSINKYFIYKTLRNLCFDFLRKRKPEVVIELKKEECEESYNAMDILYMKIHKEMETWHPYDARLFELYLYSGLSYRDLAHGTDKIPKRISKDKTLSKLAVKRGSGISVSNMFTTIRTCKEKLREKLGEDFEDFHNGEFHLIHI